MVLKILLQQSNSARYQHSALDNNMLKEIVEVNHWVTVEGLVKQFDKSVSTIFEHKWQIKKLRSSTHEYQIKLGKQMYRTKHDWAKWISEAKRTKWISKMALSKFV